MEEEKIAFAGRGPSDYAGLLYRRDRSLEDARLSKFLRAVKAALPEGKYFQLGRIPAAGSLSRSLCEGRGTFRGVPGSEVVAPRFSMDLAPQHLRKKSLRRREKALRKLGEVQINTHTCAESIQERLPALFEQHTRRWNSEGVQSQFADPLQRDFFISLTTSLKDRDILRYTEVLCDGHPVALHFGFNYGGVFTWYKPSYDPDFSRSSPGELLLKSLIERALEDNAEVFDFTIGNEAFKSRFADSSPVVQFVNVTSSPLLAAGFRVKRKLREFRRSV